MIEIKLSFATVAEAHAALTLLNGKSAPGNAPAATSSTPGPSALPASSRKPAASPKPAETLPADDTPAGIDYATEVKPLVLKVAAVPVDAGGGRDAVALLLKKFDAAKGTDVKAADLPAFKAELEAIIATAEAAA